MLATRRDILKYVPAIAALPVFAAAGCAATPATTIEISKISSYFTLAQNGLVAILASPVIQGDLGPANFANANAALGDVKAVVADVEGVVGSVTLATAQGWAEEVQSDANVVLPLVAVIPGLPESAAAIITAVQVVLPILLAAVQSGLASSARKAAPSGMTLDQAIAILKAPKV